MARQTHTGSTKKPSDAVARTRSRRGSDKAQTSGSSRQAEKSDRKLSLGADVRRHMIEEAAYYRAEKRGFRAGHEMQDWLEAEAEIVLTLPEGGMH